MKRILITGKNSYIGENFENYLLKSKDLYEIDTIDLKDSNWREYSFEGYDVIFHVAGIAHVSTDPKMEDLYYKVNRDLTIEVAKKAKFEKVNQFIFMSSIIVYGDSKLEQKVINKNTLPNPSNFYGMSKLQAEEGIIKLTDNSFTVSIIRPPMIYGKGSKGNYQRLSKFTSNFPVFPNYRNKRSMLFVDNLCEFLKVVIDTNAIGLFYPQNMEYVSTTELVRQIAKNHNKKVVFTKVFNPIIKFLITKNLTFNKVFGDLIYDRNMNGEIEKLCNFVSFEESITKTEK